MTTINANNFISKGEKQGNCERFSSTFIVIYYILFKYHNINASCRLSIEYYFVLLGFNLNLTYINFYSAHQS